MTILIGITGRARAGKDTLAQIFVQQGLRQVAFADPIKAIASIVSGEPISNFYADDLKELHSAALGMTRRRAMQLIGTDMFREAFGPDVWSRCRMAQWEAAGKPATAVSDVRYDNEAQAIRSAGGIVVRIVRPDNVGLTGEVALHSSERGVSDDLVDIEIVNDGTIGELKHEALKVLTLLESGRERA